MDGAVLSCMEELVPCVVLSGTGWAGGAVLSTGSCRGFYRAGVSPAPSAPMVTVALCSSHPAQGEGVEQLLIPAD